MSVGDFGIPPVTVVICKATEPIPAYIEINNIYQKYRILAVLPKKAVSKIKNADKLE